MNNKIEKDLPKSQKSLLLPEKDLLLPEKEIPAAIIEQKTKLSSKWLIIGVAAAILFLISAISAFLLLQNNAGKQSVCTQEAKLCPDGSSVGRTGPKCEFSPCPTPTPDPTVNWKIYQDIDKGFTIKYPPDFYAQPNAADLTVIFDSCEKCEPMENRPTLSIATLSRSLDKDSWHYISPPIKEIEKLFNLKIGYSIQINPEQNESDYNTYKKLQNIKIGGMESIVTENKSWPDGGIRRHVFVKTNGDIYDIAIPSYTTNEELHNFQLFLSTFKFTK